MEELQNENKEVKVLEDKKWCVYIHTNKINNKAYIGITSRSAKARWGNDGSGYKRNDNPVFYNAIKKYGWDNFEHIIWAENLTEFDAKQWECRLITLFKTNCKKYTSPEFGYNMNDGGDGNSGHVLSEESRKKISEHHADVSGKNNPNYGKLGENSPNYGRHMSEKTRKKLSEINKGKVLSEETKEKIRQSRLGRRATEETKIKLKEARSGKNNHMYGKHHSEETKIKISNANKAIWTEEYRKQISKARKGMNLGCNHPKARTIVQLTKDDDFVRYWECIKDAASYIGVNAASIRGCLTGRQKTSGGYKWMDKKEYDNLNNKKQRIIVLSDIHGFYDEMITALNNVNFNLETDFLISLGDEMDRGPNPEKVINFLMSLPNAIFVKGNHTTLMEELLERKYPCSHDYSNGTFQSVLDLTPNANTFEAACIIAEQKVKPFFDKEVNYFETENYIFVHSWIPLKCKDGLPKYYTHNRKFEFNPDWRNAHESEWDAARWGNPFDLASKGLLPDKTIVFGHFHTSYARNKFDGEPEFGENADFSIYHGDGFIGIDACTAYSGKVNILVLEDNFLEKPIDKS